MTRKKNYAILDVVGVNMEKFQQYLDDELSKVVFDDSIEEDEIDSLEIILARQIIQARKQKNISQLALSKKIGIQQASLSKIENGEGNPSLRTLQRIAIGLDKNLIIILE